VKLPLGVLVIYRPKQGREAKFFALVRRHGAALDEEGLVT